MSDHKTPNTILIKWALHLEEFDYEMKYKHRKINYVTHALSIVKIQNLPREVNASTRASTTILEDDFLSMLYNVDEILEVKEINLN